MTTMVALKLALSLMPMQRMKVISSAITNAGRLKPISKPNIFGAFIKSCARATSSGECAALIINTLSMKACVPGTSDVSEATAIWRAMVFSAVRSAVQWS